MMVINKRYKRTDIGVIPNDWNLLNLGDLTTKIGSGITPKGGEKVYTDRGRPFVRSQNISWGKLNLSDIAYINEVTHSTFTATEIKLNDVLLNITGASIGRSAVADERIKCGNVNQHVCIIRVNEKVVNPYFLNAFLLSHIGQKLIDSFQTGGNRQGLNFGQIKSFQIPVPPTIEEQNAITKALNETDALIESLQKLIAKKQNVKQATMQVLLTGRKRLKGFKGEWVMKSLEQIGKITGAGVDKKIRENEVKVRLVNYMDVFKNDFIYSKQLNHEVTAPFTQVQRCSVRKGDIFFTPSSEMRYDIAISAVAMEDIADATYSYHVVRLRLEEDWDLAFRAYIFKTNYFLSQAEAICEGSGKRYVISLRKFRQLNVMYPISKDEQQAISNVLYDMDAEIATLQAQLLKYKLMKEGMLQNLLTGKVR